MIKLVILSGVVLGAVVSAQALQQPAPVKGYNYSFDLEVGPQSGLRAQLFFDLLYQPEQPQYFFFAYPTIHLSDATNKKVHFVRMTYERSTYCYEERWRHDEQGLQLIQRNPMKPPCEHFPVVLEGFVDINPYEVSLCWILDSHSKSSGIFHPSRFRLFIAGKEQSRVQFEWVRDGHFSLYRLLARPMPRGLNEDKPVAPSRSYSTSSRVSRARLNLVTREQRFPRGTLHVFWKLASEQNWQEFVLAATGQLITCEAPFLVDAGEVHMRLFYASATLSRRDPTSPVEPLRLRRESSAEEFSYDLVFRADDSTEIVVDTSNRWDASFTVQVIDPEGGPIDGALVWFYDGKSDPGTKGIFGHTDAGGLVRFPSGRILYTSQALVCVSVPGGGYQPQSSWIDLPPPEPALMTVRLKRVAEDASIHRGLPGGGVLQLVLVDADTSQRLQGARVVLRRRDGQEFWGTITDRNGLTRVPVPGIADYDMTIELDGRSFSGGELRAGSLGPSGDQLAQVDGMYGGSITKQIELPRKKFVKIDVSSTICHKRTQERVHGLAEGGYRLRFKQGALEKTVEANADDYLSGAVELSPEDGPVSVALEAGSDRTVIAEILPGELAEWEAPESIEIAPKGAGVLWLLAPSNGWAAGDQARSAIIASAQVSALRIGETDLARVELGYLQTTLEEHLHWTISEHDQAGATLEEFGDITLNQGKLDPRKLTSLLWKHVHSLDGAATWEIVIVAETYADAMISDKEMNEKLIAEFEQGLQKLQERVPPSAARVTIIEDASSEPQWPGTDAFRIFTEAYNGVHHVASDQDDLLKFIRDSVQ